MFRDALEKLRTKCDKDSPLQTSVSREDFEYMEGESYSWDVGQDRGKSALDLGQSISEASLLPAPSLKNS